jgi:SAM-dependent methyltransferase
MSAGKRLYYRYVYPNQKLHYRLLPYALFAKFLLEHLSAFPRQLLTVDLIRFFVCLPRYVFRSLLGGNRTSDSTTGVSTHTIRHNIRGMAELSAPRSHVLIRPLMSVDAVKRHVADLKILSIGPRTEGEIFNLVGYGFRRKNIVGLDLVSYSPYIKVGNMHQMPFDDHSFDVVICGWVLGYSDDKPQAVREILRVVKPGGTVAVGVAFSTLDDLEHRTGGLPGSAQQVDDLATMEELFRDGDDFTYFRHDGSNPPVNGSGIITIFRAR